MNFNEFTTWLDTFLNFEKLPQKNIFWLDVMQALSTRLSHPELAAPCVHVAGSKGKGSVARMIASILTESGKTTGLYTSPHITDFYERVTQNGTFFAPEIYSATTEELRTAVDAFQKAPLPNGRNITWFELVTLYAFLCFRKANTAANVFEVGLGGRLDATNIVQPKVSVINTIELEHTEYLGDTLELIAAEKAGIIKQNTPVISAAATPSVKAVFAQKARELDAPLYFADELLEKMHFCYTRENGQFFMQTEFSSKLFRRPLHAKMRLLGEVQAQNAFLAAAAVRLAFPEIGEDAIERGLENATLRARFEIMNCHAELVSASISSRETLKQVQGDNAFFVLDGAHTVNSIRGTLETFDAIFGVNGVAKKIDVANEPPEKILNSQLSTLNSHLLFACAADKDVEHIAELFKLQDGSPRFSRITLTSLNSVKKSNPQKCAAAFSKAGLSFIIEEDLQKALHDALEAAKKDGATLLAIGSFYLAAEIIQSAPFTTKT